MKPISIVLLSIFFLLASTKTAEEWKSRAIYQIVTDRFARPDKSVNPCENLYDYCGGTFKAIETNLDYIQGLGVDAIWISPVTENAEGHYHGYAYTNFFEINPNFGTKDDLKDLIKALHERDMWIMVDVVPNHVAIVKNHSDFSSITPFNKVEHYHWPDISCEKIDPANQVALESCWLWGLPDLNHENEFVRQTLMNWIRDFVQTYDVDGLRADAVRHVSKKFWEEFKEAAGVFIIGEVFNNNTVYGAQYQGPLDSLLNFPLRKQLLHAFRSGESMNAISQHYQKAVTDWPDMTVLGNFLDNHDLPRFLHEYNDIASFKAALSFAISSVGIPIIYYGEEQAFNGGKDPENREPLWTSMRTDSEMYQYLKTLVTFRRDTEFYKHDQVERLVDEHFYAFSRGQYFFAFTNSEDEQIRTVNYHPYQDGAVLCNIFNQDKCVEVKNGEFQLCLQDKQVQILAPKKGETKEKAKRFWQNLKDTICIAKLVGNSIPSGYAFPQ